MEKVSQISFVFKCGVKHCGCSLMQHVECISTAVRVMDRGASLSTATACSYLHTINLQDGRKRERERGGGEGIYVCYTVEEVEEVEVAGKFVPSQELLSLSLGHTWFHQGARPSFIIDANLFRADWWQSFLPFIELVPSFIKGPKLPAN